MIGIVLGHDSIKQGANNFDGISEWAFYTENLLRFVEECPPEIMDKFKLYFRNGLLPNTENFIKLAEEMIDDGVTAVFELHFNAFDGKTPINRAEVLHSSHDEAKHLARQFTRIMRNIYNTTTVSKILQKGDRGFTQINVFEQHGLPLLILETCYGDTRNRLSELFFMDRRKFNTMIRDLVDL